MNKVFGNIEINRRSIHDEILNQYNQNIIKESKAEPENVIQQTSYAEDMLLSSFKASLNIKKNGQDVGINDYYGDFKLDKNKLYSNYIPVKPTNEPVEQVDPISFFGNSLKGTIK